MSTDAMDDTYFGHQYPKEPDPQLKDWPLTGSRFRDEPPTERQQRYVEWLVDKYGFNWRVDPRSITKGIAGGLISWLKDRYEFDQSRPIPGWIAALITAKDWIRI